MPIASDENPVWADKYRPKTLDDCILPPAIKGQLTSFAEKKSFPNLLLAGRAGIGKTTAAKALCSDAGMDSYIVNSSMHGNIDTLRNDILSFASTVSLKGRGTRKVVILDEADYLNPNSTQPALRNFMEQYSTNCGFILTCNYVGRIIEPLMSRVALIDFKVTKEDKQGVALAFMKRLEFILKSESVEYDKKALVALILKYFPDCRKMINVLQKYASENSKVDSGILVELDEASFSKLMVMLKEKDFTAVRKWVGENTDTDQVELFRKLYDHAHDYLKPESIPQLVLTLGDYQHKAAFVADQEINTMACLTELMGGCDFK